MGMPMARNLHEAGLLGAVWNRTADKSRALAAELGVTTSESLAEVVRGLDAVVICVSADADVRSVIEAMAPELGASALVIDCSTVSADTARWAETTLAARGARFVDAPVSGGVEGAQKGTLAIMCGGSPQAFEDARPVLAAMGKTIEHFGPSGAGQATKATNQIMCAGIIRACAEAMAFAGAHDLPLDRVVATLGAGAGSMCDRIAACLCAASAMPGANLRRTAMLRKPSGARNLRRVSRIWPSSRCSRRGRAPDRARSPCTARR